MRRRVVPGVKPTCGLAGTADRLAGTATKLLCESDLLNTVGPRLY